VLVAVVQEAQLVSILSIQVEMVEVEEDQLLMMAAPLLKMVLRILAVAVEAVLV
tara:strand:- start:1 stop:162 length:162 start_codon:yes stop_codon:yes gene_type:complete